MSITITEQIQHIILDELLGAELLGHCLIPAFSYGDDPPPEESAWVQKCSKCGAGVLIRYGGMGSYLGASALRSPCGHGFGHKSIFVDNY